MCATCCARNSRNNATEPSVVPTDARCGLRHGRLFQLWRSNRRCNLFTPIPPLAPPIPNLGRSLGILFSIEATSTYYPVRNYVLTFQCAVISAIVYQLARWVHLIYPHCLLFNLHSPCYPGSQSADSQNSWQLATAPTFFPHDCWVYAELLFHGMLGKLLFSC